MTNVSVLALDGKKLKEIELPEVFNSEIDAVLIKRAVLAVQSARFQPTGPSKRAGRDYTAKYIGARRKPTVHRTINIERARLPKLKNRRYIIQGDVALVPHARHGARVHRLKPEEIWQEFINKKERRKAIAAAIAATGKLELVKQRHRVDENLKLPIVVENKVESLNRTKKVVEVLNALKLWQDVERAKDKVHVRAGKGKKRGRRLRKPRSLLIVVENPEKIYRAARNLTGVEVVAVKNLNAELLAPSTLPGRLTIWSEGAVAALGSRG